MPGSSNESTTGNQLGCGWKHLFGPPGLGGCFFLITMIAFLYGSFVVELHNLLRDSDIAWLIKTGEWIVQNQQVPFNNIFGLDAAQKAIPFVCYQWLFEVFYGILYPAFGLHGIAWFAAVMAGLIMTSLSGWLYSRGFRGVPDILGALILSLFILFLFNSARPFLVSFWFSILLLWLFSSRLSFKQLMIWIPLLFLLWANIHLGFVAGMGILVTYCLLERKRFSLKQSALLSGTSFLVTFINPNGLDLYGYLWTLGNSKFMNSVILELQTPNFHTWPFLLFFFAFGVFSLAMTWRNDRVTLTERVWFMISFTLTLFSLRHIYLFAIFSAPVMAACIGQLWDRFVNPSGKPMFQGFSAEKERPVVWVLIVAAFGLWLADIKAFPAAFMKRQVPMGVIQYLKEHPIQEKILTQETVGSYLLFFTPERGFIDTRMDMYGDDYVKKVSWAYGLEKDWLTFFKENNVRYVLYPKADIKSVVYLQSLYDWKTLFKDDEFILLHHPNPQAMQPVAEIPSAAPGPSSEAAR
jgi:hypothetical protein